METLRTVDPEVADAIEEEGNQQIRTIELNAATNLCSRAVLEAQGNLFAYKTLEGYPGSRYHGGHGRVDVIENLARERAKKLFGAEHANIQPHSGVSANLAVYFAMLNPGDAILGMDLAMGGHLSHGHKATFSGKFLTAFSYGVEPEGGRIDYGEVARTARKEKPKMILCGGSAYPRIIDFAQFRSIADDVGAFLMADMAHVAGLVVDEETLDIGRVEVAAVRFLEEAGRAQHDYQAFGVGRVDVEGFCDLVIGAGAVADGGEEAEFDGRHQRRRLAVGLGDVLEAHRRHGLRRLIGGACL